MAMFDVDQQALVAALAAELKRQHVVVPPEWAAFAKTGSHRERPPADEDWWYTRAASVLRTVYLYGPIGTQKLRTRYGGRKNRGVAPDRFRCAGGNHLRKILQQLEAAKLVKQDAKGVHKGRVITPLGRKLIHALAAVVKAEQAPAPAPSKTAAKPAPAAADDNSTAEASTEKPKAEATPDAAEEAAPADAPAADTEAGGAADEKAAEDKQAAAEKAEGS